jgi:sugar-specific transcriptional regulator TrmB
MDEDELRDVLRDAGLSQYQADAYCTLLRLGTASARELAEESTVPSARIYDVLRDIEEHGYIETYEQDSLRARACDPSEVLADLRGRADRLREAAGEIEELWSAPAVERHKVSIVKRFDTVRDRAAAVVAEADDEVQVCLSLEELETLRPALESAMDRGAIVKVCVWTDPSTDADLPPSETFEGVATEVRHRTLPTPFLALVDRDHTCFAPNAVSTNQYGVLVEDFTMTYVFHWYFQTCLWEIWDRVYSAQASEPPIEYTGVREVVRDVGHLVEDGATVTVRVKGYRRGTREAVDLSGTLADVIYTGEANEAGTPPLSQLAGQVSLVVETATGPVTVGGWGAVVEDIEATRVTVDSIDPAGAEALEVVGSTGPGEGG